jgi:hypothetical protein
MARGLNAQLTHERAEKRYKTDGSRAEAYFFKW